MIINWRKIFVYVLLILVFTFIGNFIIQSSIHEKPTGISTSIVDQLSPLDDPIEVSKPINFPKPVGSVPNKIPKSKPSSPDVMYPNLDNTWIMIVTYARTEYIEKTLNSILELPGLSELNLVISQDGVQPHMIRFLENYVEKFKKFKRIERFHCETKGLSSQRIAQNYKCGLRAAFEEFKADKVIIVEDDLVVSPDFLKYFDRTIHLLSDPTVWCISSWNDFGYSHLVDDPKRVFRTQYFPGLGWAMNKDLWKELKPNWPSDLWDENMRVDSISKNRDCIVPELSRNYNIGVFGANMKRGEYDAKLKGTVWNQDISIDLGDLGYLEASAYETKMKTIVASSKRIHSISEIVGIGNVYLITFNSATRADLILSLRIPLREMRTIHEGTVIVKWQKNTLILANERTSPYLEPPNLLEKDPSFTLVPGKRGGSCVETCVGASLHCDPTNFDYIMDCRTLSKFFPCERCGVQFGPDMPNFVQSSGTCLITQAFTPTCEGKHPTTTRLCPCIKK
jgi:alpha-1,3-mannosyl-glycoprotein beta-1,2-N-acetylglucosaminyltransferase